MRVDIRGHLILLMAPMASGKGVLTKYINEAFPRIKRLVSCTTRPPRPNEVEGADYYFLSYEGFKEKIAHGDFVEWAEFCGNLYGTLASEIINRLQENEVVLNEIDLQGVRQLMDIIPKEHRTIIYIEAGEWETLVTRAKARAPISHDELILRKHHYDEERAFKDRVDYIIENNDGQLDEAKKKIHEIIRVIVEKVYT